MEEHPPTPPTHSRPVRIFMGICIVITVTGTAYNIYSRIGREEKQKAAAMAWHEQWQKEKQQQEDEFWRRANPKGKEVFADLERALNAINSVEAITPEEIAQVRAQSDKDWILDVRPPAEFERGHIPGSINRDFAVENFKDSLKDLPTSQPWLVIGTDDSQTNTALKTLAELGVTQLYRLEGGFAAWQNANLDLSD